MAENSIERTSLRNHPKMFNRKTHTLALSVGLAVMAVLLLIQAGTVMAGATAAEAAPDADVVFITSLSGAAEVPGPGDDDGAGTIKLTVDADAGEVCYSLDFSDIAAPSAGHIHTGAADASGGVLIGLFADAAGAASGCATGVSAADMTALLDNPSGHYVNIHNADFPNGAIRGQLGSASAMLNATLTGDAEVPGPGDSDGNGTAMISINEAAGIVCYELTFDGIDAPSAGHIHTGAADASGGVLIGLFSDGADANSGCVTDVAAENISAVLEAPDGHYVNIHNAAFPAGAIRGQLADSAMAEGTATVTVAHFASFADTIDATSVTIRINGTDAITTLRYSNIVTNVELAAGDYTIEVLPTGTSTVAMSTTVTLADGVDYTVAAIGDGTNQALELLALVDDNSPSATATNAKIRIAHLAPFADTDVATQVNVCTDDGDAVLTDVPYKVFTDPYAELPAGDYDLKIVAAADGCSSEAVIDLPPITLEAGGAYDVFAVGDGGNQPLNIATTTGLPVSATPTNLMLDVQPAQKMDNAQFLPLLITQ